MAVVLCGSMAWVFVQHIRMVTNTDAFSPEAQLAQCSSQTSGIFYHFTICKFHFYMIQA